MSAVIYFTETRVECALLSLCHTSLILVLKLRNGMHKARIRIEAATGPSLLANPALSHGLASRFLLPLHLCEKYWQTHRGD